MARSESFITTGLAWGLSAIRPASSLAIQRLSLFLPPAFHVLSMQMGLSWNCIIAGVARIPTLERVLRQIFKNQQAYQYTEQQQESRMVIPGIGGILGLLHPMRPGNCPIRTRIFLVIETQTTRCQSPLRRRLLAQSKHHEIAKSYVETIHIDSACSRVPHPGVSFDSAILFRGV